ncbi:DUF6597 domain-containing transcriptional factor [Massilia sp. SM-13]|uniref:DUF6597 domain-containing transcriptional factor n=1 Tax=Pseudoduganella rhizocola TaxID=3382643 RepID=UPI0038B645B9
MLYREYPPCPALAPHVACLWTSHVRPAPGALPFMHRVLPDNCVDILWQDSGASAFAVGMMSSAIFVASSGPVRTVAVRFRPGAARGFFGLPLATLTDGRADLADLWGRSCAERLQGDLWERELSDRERLNLIERALVERFMARMSGSLPARVGTVRGSPVARLAAVDGSLLARAAVARIEACGGALRVESLADELRVSRQHLAVQFREQVGLSPKLFARITRFRRAAEKARSQHAVDWAALALDCGYFDQSHLIRDFRDFAATTPEQFLSPPRY